MQLYKDDIPIIFDKETALKELAQDGSMIEYCSPELQADKDVVITALDYGYSPALRFNKELSDNKGVVMIVVRKNGMALQYASDRMKRDPDIQEAAINQNPNAVKFTKYGLDETLQKLIDNAKRNNIFSVQKDNYTLD